MIYPLLKSVLFLFQPERAHTLTMKLLVMCTRVPGGTWLLKKLFCTEHPADATEFSGLTLKNKVGLAAGFDKDARYIDALACLGFGFVEIGTLTPKGQSGNERPRLFRLTRDRALINRMGFNNEGVDRAVERLKKRKSQIVVGGNIGKNKITPNEDAHLDYAYCFEKLYEHVDYFVVNVSSPNTPGLRELQEKPALLNIFTTLQKQRDAFMAQNMKFKPILLKIAPDLTHAQLDDIVELARQIKLDGLVVSNTTLQRDGLLTPRYLIEQMGAGGLSGKPLKQLSDEVLLYLTQKLNGEVPVMGVGGIHSPQDALDKIRLGARAVQLYTGFIYEGPGLIRKTVQALRNPPGL